MLEKFKELSQQAQLMVICVAVAVLIGGVFAVASIAGGADWESKCRKSIESAYGYSDESLDDEIQACAGSAEALDEQGVSESEIKSQLGLP